MIVSLKGIISSLKPLAVTIEVHGVGYSVKIPLSVNELLQKHIDQNPEKEYLLVIRQVFRQDGHELYGFGNEQEATMFDFLTALPGIGPGIALSLLSSPGLETLLHALSNQEEKVLTKAPRVGKAKAQKILFEAGLRKKKLMTLYENQPITDTVRATQNESESIPETIEDALLTLGYNKKEIHAAAEKLLKANSRLFEEQQSIQETIRMFLKII